MLKKEVILIWKYPQRTQGIIIENNFIIIEKFGTRFSIICTTETGLPQELIDKIWVGIDEEAGTLRNNISHYSRSYNFKVKTGLFLKLERWNKDLR